MNRLLRLPPGGVSAGVRHFAVCEKKINKPYRWLYKFKKYSTSSSLYKSLYWSNTIPALITRANYLGPMINSAPLWTHLDSC